MDLIQYLNTYFYTTQELLDISKISEDKLKLYQQQGLMPTCSHRLALDLRSESYFGEYQEKKVLEYYAKAYASWLWVIELVKSADGIFSIFCQRYKVSLEALCQRGHMPLVHSLKGPLEDYLKEEWQHFLSGTYGLCTRSGLPEDIAAKAVAIAEINQLTAAAELDQRGLEKLTAAVNLLDRSSALFAPHERVKSSRQRLVNEVRRKYQLVA